MVADARDFYFITQFPIDNIVFLNAGSQVVPNGTSDLIPGVAVPHSLTFMPLPLLVWSNTSDFAVANTLFDAQLAASYFSGYTGQQYLVYSDATNVNIQRDNSSGSSKTLYYRLYAFAPSDVPLDAVIPPTADDGDPFALNTLYNYLKVSSTGKLTSSSPAFTHGLGYSPRVLAWGVVTGQYVTPIVVPQIIDSDPTGGSGMTSGIYVNGTEIRWLNPNTFDEIEYRIYKDE